MHKPERLQLRKGPENIRYETFHRYAARWGQCQKKTQKSTIYLVLHEFTPLLIILLVLLTDQITSRAVYGDGQIKLKGRATFKKYVLDTGPLTNLFYLNI